MVAEVASCMGRLGNHRREMKRAGATREEGRKGERKAAEWLPCTGDTRGVSLELRH